MNDRNIRNLVHCQIRHIGLKERKVQNLPVLTIQINVKFNIHIRHFQLSNTVRTRQRH